MLKRVLLCLAISGAPLVAVAQSAQESIVSQLQAQGFSEIRLSRTWLGRIRVVASRGDTRRELVFNPQTGEILRDLWRDLDDGAPPLFSSGNGGEQSSPQSGGALFSGSSSFDDEDEDDEDEDDDDDDGDDDDDESDDD